MEEPGYIFQALAVLLAEWTPRFSKAHEKPTPMKIMVSAAAVMVVPVPMGSTMDGAITF
jgi:hypothetical protein